MDDVHDEFEGSLAISPLKLGGPWLRDCHGALTPSHLSSHGLTSMRELATSHRAIGFQRMAVLTGLPTSAAARSLPRQAAGVHAVGAIAGQDPRRAPLDSGAQRAPGESLGDYIDRRLTRAEVLYLPNRSRGYNACKRLIDIVGASVLILLTAPVIVLLAVLIRLDSPGPAIFRQQRVTLGGRVFTFYKFRTMWVDARTRFPQLYDYSGSAGDFGTSFYKLVADPRSTRVGRWLRRTTLDELPNLFNVLKGDMSLVGPRPELTELVPHYRPEELACFFTKAGLTGLAQVAGRSLLTVGERLDLDVRYVAQQNILLDVRILWRTAIVVVTGRGAL